jgi:hypothetical protein
MPPASKRPETDFWAKTRFTPSGCIEWTGYTNKDGYGQLRWRRKWAGAHRVAFEITNGPIPDGMKVLHSCDNPPCVSPQHLRSGTHADNARDKVERGRCYTGVQRKGEEAHNARLTEAQVREIKRLRSVCSVAVLAVMFGVSKATISRAVNGVTWPHLIVAE